MAETNGVAPQRPSPSDPQSLGENRPAGPPPASVSTPSGGGAPAGTTTTTNTTAAPAGNAAQPDFPATSISDDGQSRRPRDARLIHMVLANLGVTAYQERVPLQLLDFAYRYTSSTLQDALHFTIEGFGSTAGTSGGKGSGGGGGGGGGGAGGSALVNNPNDLNSVTLPALRLSIASRLNYQFNASLPKEFLLELAQERNKAALPNVGREWGLRLPPERYCLTGVGWGLKDEWESEGEESVNADGEGEGGGEGGAQGAGGRRRSSQYQVNGKQDKKRKRSTDEDEEMGEDDGEDEGEGDGDGEDGDARMEDLFGDQPDDDEGGQDRKGEHGG